MVLVEEARRALPFREGEFLEGASISVSDYFSPETRQLIPKDTRLGLAHFYDA